MRDNLFIRTINNTSPSGYSIGAFVFSVRPRASRAQFPAVVSLSNELKGLALAGRPFPFPGVI